MYFLFNLTVSSHNKFFKKPLVTCAKFRFKEPHNKANQGKKGGTPDSQMLGVPSAYLS